MDAVVPEAEFVKLNEGDPAPPLIRSSSVSLSSIMISMRILHSNRLHIQGRCHQPSNQSFVPLCPSVKFGKKVQPHMAQYRRILRPVPLGTKLSRRPICAPTRA